MTCVVSAVLAVMATVPAVRFVRAARECVVAMLVAAIGALATSASTRCSPWSASSTSPSASRWSAPSVSSTGWVPVCTAWAVADWSGWLVGGACSRCCCSTPRCCAATARPGLVDGLLDGVRWCRENLGAFPRPIEAVLGVPALAWGVHMRARRRQGWWLCAFGVADDRPVANSLVNPAISLRECGLSVVYGLLVGLVIGYAVIRADLALTGHHGRGAPADGGGRRGAARAAPVGRAAVGHRVGDALEH